MDPRLKALIEERNAKVAEMSAIRDAALEEKRALSDEEDAKFETLEKEVRALDGTIKRAQQELLPILATTDVSTRDDNGATGAETPEEIKRREIKDFADFLRNEMRREHRDATNLTKGDNGAVIPSTIANMIIKQLVEISPIFAAATKFNVKGTLSIPYYDETEGQIEVAYAEEFQDLASHSAKFGSIELTGFLIGSLSKISRSLINNSDFDLVNFVVNDMAEKVAQFIEKTLLFGDSKQDGLKNIKIKTDLAADNPTADELIEIQDSIRDAFQRNAFWIMSRKTRTAVRQLKDNENRYMLNPDITNGFGYTLLGKPVYTSDAITDGSIFYGDFSGLAVKSVEQPEIEVLRELFALSHVIGVVVWFEMDSKIFDAQRMAIAKKAAD